VAAVVVDGALSVALEGFAEGRYESARARVPKMLSEEAFHRDLGLAWLKRLANGTDEARERIREAARFALPGTLAWLAPDDDAHAALVGAHLTAPAGALLQRFRDQLGAALEAAGIEIPAPDTRDWDAARGRGPGAPEEEVVVRARGDLNRALLVE
jgi:1,2-phenylacetyl-CoA epoxidase catalytic subunit